MEELPIYPNTDPFNAMRISMARPLNAALAATMVPVRFTGNVGPYKGGEIARFLPTDAAALVAAGLVVAA
jgi:hypothetical protein